MNKTVNVRLAHGLVGQEKLRGIPLRKKRKRMKRWKLFKRSSKREELEKNLRLEG